MTTATKPAAIRLMKHYVTDGTHRARVWYSNSPRVDGRECVTIYGKDYTPELGKIFGAAYRNDSDGMTDYFETGRVSIFADSPLYAAALARCDR